MAARGYSAGSPGGWQEMIKFNPLPSAPYVYSQSEESLFRRGVENSLISAYSELGGAVSAQGGEASPASKRESLLIDQPGISIRSGTATSESVNIASDRSKSSDVNVMGLEKLLIHPYFASVPLVIENFTGGVPGQKLTVFSYQTTGLRLSNSLGNLTLAGNVDLVFPTSFPQYSNATLVFVSGVWVEIGRTFFN